MRNQVKTISLSIKDTATYMWAAVFVAANVALPQLCHAAGISGQIFIPIMFFTLFATIRFGLACGLLTALISPAASFLISGMPAAEILPVIIVKSAALATVLGLIINKAGRINLIGVIAAVAVYQFAGFMLQGFAANGFAAAWSAVAISWPGMVIQIAAGTLMAHLIFKKA